jgi:hypothetical protein
LIESYELKHPGIVANMTNWTDKAIGKYYGLTRSRVQQMRTRLSFPSQLSTIPVRVWTEEDQRLIGTMTNAAAARHFSTSPGTIRKLRDKFGLPTIRKEDAFAPVSDLIGKVPDTQIAQMINRSSASVFHYRKTRGIKTIIMSSQHPDFKPIDRKKVETMFMCGFSRKAIADVLTCSEGTIYYIIRELCISRKPRQSFPWSHWMNGQLWVIRKGVHFSGSVEGMVQRIMSVSIVVGMRVTVSAKETIITFQYHLGETNDTSTI